MATVANLNIMVEEDDVVEGWVGKPKRARQVLWEWGLLDLQLTYVSKIRKDSGKQHSLPKHKHLTDLSWGGMRG